mmetsp:Transcript_13273/g.21973  ORF Transcript_13273/g.21973 Transcript_13273/m.21973 type:complete len:216 (-) Transcript_13273:386-1033(-)
MLRFRCSWSTRTPTSNQPRSYLEQQRRKQSTMGPYKNRCEVSIQNRHFLFSKDYSLRQLPELHRSLLLSQARPQVELRLFTLVYSQRQHIRAVLLACHRAFLRFRRRFFRLLSLRPHQQRRRLLLVRHHPNPLHPFLLHSRLRFHHLCPRRQAHRVLSRQGAHRGAYFLLRCHQTDRQDPLSHLHNHPYPHLFPSSQLVLKRQVIVVFRVGLRLE